MSGVICVVCLICLIGLPCVVNVLLRVGACQGQSGGRRALSARGRHFGRSNQTSGKSGLHLRLVAAAHRYRHRVVIAQHGHDGGKVDAAVFFAHRCQVD